MKHELLVFFQKEDDGGQGCGGHHLSGLNHGPSRRMWTVAGAAA